MCVQSVVKIYKFKGGGERERERDSERAGEKEKKIIDEWRKATRGGCGGGSSVVVVNGYREK